MPFTDAERARHAGRRSGSGPGAELAAGPAPPSGVAARSVGVEEELLLVDSHTGLPRAAAGTLLEPGGGGSGTGRASGFLAAELQREQVETGTRPCMSMSDLEAQVRRWRRAASERARCAGAEVAALATSPLPVAPSLSPMVRYRRMAREFALTAQEQLTCGCHVHVHVASDEEGVGVIDRIRCWLPTLLAISANSPFWQGQDTGYSSYRNRVWGRWPSAGPVEPFGSADAYHAEVRALLASGTLLDEGMVYFDARLSRSYPTVEIRVADVCLDTEDAVLIAALARGLVETAARAWKDGRPPARVGTALLRLATWRAARSGLCGMLLHPKTHTPAPAEAVTVDLLGHVAPALAEVGDLELVTSRLREVHRRGNGAQAQRASRRRKGSLNDVVRDAVTRTTA